MSDWPIVVTQPTTSACPGEMRLVEKFTKGKAFTDLAGADLAQGVTFIALLRALRIDFEDDAADFAALWTHANRTTLKEAPPEPVDPLDGASSNSSPASVTTGT